MINKTQERLSLTEQDVNMTQILKVQNYTELKRNLNKLHHSLNVVERSRYNNFEILKTLRSLPVIEASLIHLVKRLSDDDELLIDVIDKLKLETAQKGETVYIQGDNTNKKFYFMLEGNVSFLMSNDLKSLWNKTEANNIEEKANSVKNVNTDSNINELLVQK